jgi:hypothetical protein
VRLQKPFMVLLRSSPGGVNYRSEEQMNYRELLQSVKRRPGMYGINGAYSSAVAFVLGCDAAMSGTLLHGFREWLIVRLGDGNNLAWHALVMRVLGLQDQENAEFSTVGSEINMQPIEGLFELLDEFFEERDRPNGMIRIYNSYLTWLSGQEWFRLDMLE